MGVRTFVDLKLQAGLDNSLDSGNLIFDRILQETEDTLDKARTIANQSLDAGEQNVVIEKGDIDSIRLLYVESEGDLDVFLGGSAATGALIQATGAAYPTGFAGGETLDLEIDGVTVDVTFSVGDTTLALIVSRINARAAFLGLNGLVASDVAGQLKLASLLTGLASQVKVVAGSGTTIADLGLPVAGTEVLGIDPTPGASAVLLRPTAAGNKGWLLVKTTTTSVTVSNPDTAAAVRYSIHMAGDLVTPADC
jgi:hypothetical protein